jgi:hypothetical protein
MVDLVKARRDVRLEHPLIVPGGRSQVVNLGDGVLCSAPGAEAVGTWLEVRLEDRLQHQLQRGLHDPVRGGRDTEAADLARCLRDRLLPHPLRNEHAGLQVEPKPGQQFRSASADDISRSETINSSCSCTRVAPHPAPRGHEERRVINKVVQIIEPAARIGRRPSVQLRLHRQYPRPRRSDVRPRFAGVHQRTPADAKMPRSRWTPSPCDRLSRPRTTTDPPPRPGRVSRRRAFPRSARWLRTRSGATGVVPTFTLDPFDGIGAQLCPCSIAAITPQTFTAASRPATSPGPGVPGTARTPSRCALLPSPYPSGWSWWLS